MTCEWCPVADVLPSLLEPLPNQVSQHIADCPVCKNQKRMMDGFRKRLISRILSKGDHCPDEEDVALYGAGTLKGDDAQRIEKHLVHCAYCKEVLTMCNSQATPLSEAQQKEMLDTAIALLPLKNVTVEYASALKRAWKQLAPSAVRWIKQGARAMFSLDTDKPGFYRISLAGKWSETLQLPALPVMGAPTIPAPKPPRVAARKDTKAGGFVLEINVTE